MQKRFITAYDPILKMRVPHVITKDSKVYNLVTKKFVGFYNSNKKQIFKK